MRKAALPRMRANQKMQAACDNIEHLRIRARPRIGKETGAYRNRQCELRASRKWERLPPARTKARDGRTCASALDIARQSRYNEIGCRPPCGGRKVRGGWSRGGMLVEEKWMLYDAERRPLGRLMVRGEPVPEGCYARSVQVWIRDGAGRFLLSRRHADKPAYPLCWETVGGAVIAGEDSLGAALREVREELGIALARRLGRFSSASAGRATSPTSGCFAGKARWRR